MHDMLFENQKSFGGADMNALTMEYASKLGLQKKAFQKVYSSPKTAARIKDDMDLASVIGARGTPTFYINGIPLVGAQPFARFEEIIKGQIERAKGLQDKDKGLVGEALYLALVNLNKKDKPPAAPKAKPKPALDPNAVYSVPVGASSQRGPEDAWVTLVVFSEFQCPFCGRVAPTIDKILATYGKKVRFVFKHNPLSFHKQALSAANAVECAGAQGQFWPMHDILFANQRALTDADLESLL
jgi:protein-disulfide isomerase